MEEVKSKFPSLTGSCLKTYASFIPHGLTSLMVWLFLSVRDHFSYINGLFWSFSGFFFAGSRQNDSTSSHSRFEKDFTHLTRKIELSTKCVCVF